MERGFREIRCVEIFGDAEISYDVRTLPFRIDCVDIASSLEIIINYDIQPYDGVVVVLTRSLSSADGQSFDSCTFVLA